MLSLVSVKHNVHVVGLLRLLTQALRLCLPLIICATVIIQVSQLSIAYADPSASAKPDKATDNSYLLDKFVTWSDGSSEHVQIGSDGFFVLNGTKEGLVGMDLVAYDTPDGKIGQFWLPENISIYDKELTYLESIGVRLIYIDMQYIRWWMPSMPTETGASHKSLDEEKAAYKSLLDLVYKHKMLVVPAIFGKWFKEFDISGRPDFSIQTYHQTDTMSAWTERWIDIVAQYPNVVAVRVEDELDYPLTGDLTGGQTQKYTVADVQNYMNQLLKIIRPKIDCPIVHDLVGDMDSQLYRTDIKQACLHMTDHPAFNFHFNSISELSNKAGGITAWLGQEGYPTSGWWCFELSKSYPPDNANITADYVDTLFKQGASLVTLYEANNETPEYNGWAFFDAKGTPKPQMTLMAKEIPAWQVALSQPADKSLEPIAAGANVTLTSAIAVNNLPSSFYREPDGKPMTLAR